MANILIIDDQAWVKNLCRESLTGEGHNVSTTDDIESVMKNVLSFKPDFDSLLKSRYSGESRSPY